MTPYDVIVLGTGGIGSAALSALARRGVRVLGLDQFPPAHDRGSSHGQTRLIRQAYYEHPDYVPLVLRSYKLWAELAERRETTLFYQTGLLQVGPADGVVLPGVMASARQHGLAVEPLAGTEVTRRWPGFRAAAPLAAVYEPRAGYLLVEECVRAHLADAVAAGAELRTEETVEDFRAGPNEIVVKTARNEFCSSRLVITAGPWAARWLSNLRIPLVVRRKPLFWFATASPVYRAADGCPSFLYETARGSFYGFPEIESGEIKIAEHSGGEQVDDPARVDRELRAEDQMRLTDFAAECMPDVTRRCTHHTVCMYTMSPDQHFIIDRHPSDPRMALAAGFSGHGFKFAPVMGEALADLALEGHTALPIEFLNCRRPALRTG
jgi:sarcosine oxidase